MELRSTTVSDDALGEHWRPLVDAVDDALVARAEDPSLPLHKLGRFELEELVGFGGMGLVFKARDPRLERTIALKLWKLEAEDAEEALLREAKLQARVSHANVVTIFEVGKIGADVYLAMEFAQGMDLRRWMHTNLASWELVLALMVNAGRGLAAVHGKDLVHADFKPENILVCTNGRVLVADFGVARILDERARGEGMSSGRGTKAYMAPERLERRQTDERSDQFSFCVTLWECLYGVRPFAGHTAEELLTSMVVGELQRGTVEDEGLMHLERVLRRGLALEPDARFADMEALLRALVHVPEFMVRRRRVRAAALAMLGSGLCGALLALALVGVFEDEVGSSDSLLAEHEQSSNEMDAPLMETDQVGAGDGGIENSESTDGQEDPMDVAPDIPTESDDADSLKVALELVTRRQFQPAYKEWKRVFDDAQLIGVVEPEPHVKFAERMLHEAQKPEVKPATAHEGADNALNILLAVTSVEESESVRSLVVEAVELLTKTDASRQ